MNMSTNNKENLTALLLQLLLLVAYWWGKTSGIL
jgi:hypothetical protein